MSERRLFPPREAAIYLGHDPDAGGIGWLAKLRHFGGGPRFVKLGGRIVYDRCDLEAWVEANRRGSTSEPATPSATAA